MKIYNINIHISSLEFFEQAKTTYPLVPCDFQLHRIIIHDVYRIQIILSRNLVFLPLTVGGVGDVRYEQETGRVNKWQ